MKFRFQKRATDHSIDNLKADSSTIRYEFDMLVESAMRYRDADARGDSVGKNIAVESFSVHCRAIIAFLFGHLEGLEADGFEIQRFGGARVTDIFAWDYYPGWQFDCPRPSDEMYHAKRRADKHVAHVTIDRRGVNQEGTGVESAWDMHAAVNELGAAMALFLIKAPAVNFDAEELLRMKSRLTPWLEPELANESGATFIAKSGPMADIRPAVSTQAKTEGRTDRLPPAQLFGGTTD